MTKDDLLTFDGTTQPVTEWALDYGIPPTRILERLDRGWPVDQAITEPVPVSVSGKILPDNKRRRHGRTLTFKGVTRTISEWSETLHIEQATINQRIRSGLPIDKVLSTTPLPRGRPKSSAPTGVVSNFKGVEGTGVRGFPQERTEITFSEKAENA